MKSSLLSLATVLALGLIALPEAAGAPPVNYDCNRVAGNVRLCLISEEQLAMLIKSRDAAVRKIETLEDTNACRLSLTATKA